jgi:hypothetical protein
MRILTEHFGGLEQACEQQGLKSNDMSGKEIII